MWRLAVLVWLQNPTPFPSLSLFSFLTHSLLSLTSVCPVVRDLNGALLFKLVRSLLALMTLSRVYILNRFFAHSLDVRRV